MGAKWIKISAIYLIIGIGFGLFMHSTVQLQWGATHAHINVVGWLTTAVIGLIYSVYPQAGNNSLGKAQFWLHNIGLPVLLIGMMIIQPSLGAPGFLIELCVWLGGLAFALSIILLIVNLFTNLKETTQN